MATKIIETPFIESASKNISPPLRNSLMYPRLGGNEVRENTIFARHLVVSSRGWVHDIEFTATDHDTVTWDVATITFANNTSTSLLSGTTGNMAAKTFIYFDNTDTLKTSTTLSDTIGDEKILVAIAQPAASGGKAVVAVLQSDGTTINGNQITTGKIQSSDTNTYFDLDNDRIIMNDGSDDRVLIGQKP